MNKYIAGILAGFLGTTVVSLLMLLKNKYGILPEFNVIEDFSQYFGDNTGTVGWLIHFVLGAIIWGCTFAILSDAIPGPYWIKGAIFGSIVWALMMVSYMPIMEHGFFAKKLGPDVFIGALIAHAIFGLVLGLTYGFLSSSEKLS